MGCRKTCWKCQSVDKATKEYLLDLIVNENWVRAKTVWLCKDCTESR